MSNPAVFELVSNEIAGTRFCIEDNIGEAIHIHIGPVRFDLTVHEFLQIAEALKEALDHILREQGINPTGFTPRSIFKLAPILSRVRSMVEKEVTLNNLSFSNPHNLDNFYFASDNILYGFANDEKLRMASMERDLVKYGYPLRGQLIIVDEHYHILDGMRQAKAMKKLYGGARKISVLSCLLQPLEDSGSAPFTEKCAGDRN